MDNITSANRLSERIHLPHIDIPSSSSAQFNCSVVSDSLRPQGLQHSRPSCPVGDAIKPFHPLSSPSPPAFNLSQHQGLFK